MVLPPSNPCSHNGICVAVVLLLRRAGGGTPEPQGAFEKLSATEETQTSLSVPRALPLAYFIGPGKLPAVAFREGQL